MKNSIKGALLSGLVIPGLGQIVLKRYKRGAALMIAVTGSLGAVVVKAAQLAIAVLEKISLEGRGIDMEAVLNAASQASAGSDGYIVNFLSAGILVCWLSGTIDAYVIGKKMDHQESLLSNRVSERPDEKPDEKLEMP